jgi:hypothetical protein
MAADWGRFVHGQDLEWPALSAANAANADAERVFGLSASAS